MANPGEEVIPNVVNVGLLNDWVTVVEEEVVNPELWGANTPGGPPKRPVYLVPSFVAIELKVVETAGEVTKPEAADEVVPNCLKTVEAVVVLVKEEPVEKVSEMKACKIVCKF